MSDQRSTQVFDWLIDFYWTLLQPKGWIAKYNLYLAIQPLGCKSVQ